MLPQLIEFVQTHQKLCVLTGAGVSTASGIPDYRDANGDWKRPAPVQFGDFVNGLKTRQRYWARSLVGWRWFKDARPNANHSAIAQLQRIGRVSRLITQNVDRLHQRAGSQNVIDLHGRLDRILCLGCGALTHRDPLQDQLLDENPAFAENLADIAPDGDADLEGIDFTRFNVPDCGRCGGILKPDVVFFGETVPKSRVETARVALLEADALLILGSSLMVYSGYRFCLIAAQHGLPMAAVNLGRTRADDLLSLKVDARCETVLDTLVRRCDGVAR